MLAVVLMTLCAAIILLLGTVHLIYTFWGPKLRPRDPTLQISMSEISPVITRETTMWKAWIGFNASHSFGAMLFGLVYGYLALLHSTFLFESLFLLGVGLTMLGGLVVLGKRYWFSIPYRGICAALVCYLGSIVAAPV